MRAAKGLNRCVPACFIAVLLDVPEALIGQWRVYTILSRPQDGPICLQLHSSAKFAAVTGCERWRETCLPVLHFRSRTSRINNPEGDVYEVLDRFEGGCSGSRGWACRLSGSQAPPERCGQPEAAGLEAAVRRCRRKELR